MADKIFLCKETCYEKLSIDAVNQFLVGYPDWRVRSITPFHQDVSVSGQSRSNKSGHYGVVVVVTDEAI